MMVFEPKMARLWSDTYMQFWGRARFGHQMGTAPKMSFLIE